MNPASKARYVTNQFTWIPLYQELAKELVHWQNRQGDLLAFLETLRRDGFVITPLNDKNKAGIRYPLKEIDPFTFFGVFNRRIQYDQRIHILARIKQFFKLKSDLPEDLNGIPILDNRKSWFFTTKATRGAEDIAKLWQVFQLALKKSPLKSRGFLKAFDEAMKVKSANINLTMGLFWINPHTFINLDETNRALLKLELPAKGLTSKFYTETVKQFSSTKKTFPELSLEAWGYQNARIKLVSEPKRAYRAKTNAQPYSLETLLAEGAFLSEEQAIEILERLQTKKALILQGAPGVGKTFLARKLAYALMEEIDPVRYEMVQFHQSYSYDDFVRGYRPMPEKNGSFGLQNGVFYEFCQRAANDPDREYVFIIDEINRGNLSQIFGELLMLIEHDKRGEEHSVPLVYQTKNEARFYIPANVHLIGLMNLADRSLALVDYALRRRFAFFTLQPQFESEIFRDWLLEREMKPRLVERITQRMSALNRAIKADPLLGENYLIGHSYFCPKGESFAKLDEAWYRSIVRTEIVPLLKEYWFDNPKKAEDAERELLA